jgi:phospholipase/lecithinase/hemolysin
MNRLIATLAAASLIALPSLAGAGYSALYAFGDSLSDSGNSFSLSSAAPGFTPWPPSPPYAQRFSNGPTAVERLAANLGTTAVASQLGGTNFAVGGAMTGTTNFNFLTQTPFPIPASVANTGITSQVASFLGSGVAFDPATTLFTLWGGPNDVFLALATGTTDFLPVIENAATNIAFAAFALAANGAQHILVPNMPNLGATPFASRLGLEVELTQISAGLNLALDLALDDARGLLDLLGIAGVNIIEFDTAALLDQVVADPAAFGFANATEPCFDAANPATLARVAGGCQGFVFFDDVHPSAQAHRILGDRFTATVPEPGSLALIAIGLFALVWYGGRRARPAKRETDRQDD